MSATKITAFGKLPPRLGPTGEAFLAELTDAAYRVALQHGFKGLFIDLQLDLWAALREVLARELRNAATARKEVEACRA